MDWVYWKNSAEILSLTFYNKDQWIHDDHVDDDNDVYHDEVDDNDPENYENNLSIITFFILYTSFSLNWFIFSVTLVSFFSVMTKVKKGKLWP